MHQALPIGALPLARSAVDRDAEQRTREALFDELLEDPATRVMPLWQGRTLMSGPSGRAPSSASPASPKQAVRLLSPAEVTSAITRVYLGRTLEAQEDQPAGTPVIAIVLSDAAAGELEADPAQWATLREVATDLSDRDAGLFTEAIAIANWHAANTHCPRCGTPTVVERGGWMRRCFVDQSELFPRTDPAVIVRVLDDDDRLLLGSNALWEHNRWSVLAGFVEAGESFEAAVARELFEEAGVRVDEITYLGSQPWPFPQSIMIGYHARLAPDFDITETRPDGEEILALRWFSRDDLWRERDGVLLPGGSSIAHAIVRDWYGGPLDEPPRARVGS